MNEGKVNNTDYLIAVTHEWVGSSERDQLLDMTC